MQHGKKWRYVSYCHSRFRCREKLVKINYLISFVEQRSGFPRAVCHRCRHAAIVARKRFLTSADLASFPFLAHPSPTGVARNIASDAKRKRSFNYIRTAMSRQRYAQSIRRKGSIQLSTFSNRNTLFDAFAGRTQKVWRNLVATRGWFFAVA